MGVHLKPERVFTLGQNTHRMQIVKASMDDLDLIGPLFNLYRIFYGQNNNLEQARIFLKERIQNNESVIFVAKNEHGVAVGFTQLYPSFSSVSASRSWILNDLYVATEARRTGVAKKLMATARTFAIETQAKGLSLETAKDNINAQKLYESLGYIRDTAAYHYFLELNSEHM